MRENPRSRGRQANRTHWAIIGLTLLLAGVVTMAGLAIVPHAGDKGDRPVEPPGEGEGLADPSVIEETQAAAAGHWIATSNEDLLAHAAEYGAIGDGTSTDPLVLDGERFKATNTTTLVLENTDRHVHIKDLRLNGTGAGTAIMLQNVRGVTFENLTIDNHHTALKATNTTHVTIQDSRFKGNHIALRLTAPKDSIIADSRFTDNDRAVQVTNPHAARDPAPAQSKSRGLTLRNNHIQQSLPHWADEEKHPHGSGIELSGRDHQIINNTIEGHEPRAIWTNGTNVFIENNKILLGSGYGISLDRTQDVTLRDNYIESRSKAAIMTHRTISTLIKGNTITDNPDGAFKGTLDQGLDFNNNTLDWNGPAITLWSTSDASIVDNRITGGDYAVKAMDHDDLRINNNRLRIFSDGAVAIFRGEQFEFINNHVSESKKYSLFLIAPTDSLVKENLLRSAKHGVIVGSGAHDTRIEGNDLYGRGHVGLRIAESEKTLLNNNKIRLHDYGVLVEKNSVTAKIQNGELMINQVGMLFLNTTTQLLAQELDVLNNKVGVKVQNSQHVGLTGLKLEDNRRGIWYDHASNNTATGNLVERNQIGLLMEQSTHNLFYDNVFNNSMARGKNAWLFGSPENQWNIERTRGVNIIGGPYIGGNLWDSYIGTDSTGDGLGEIPHRPVPYHPALEGPLYNTGVPMGPFDLHPLVDTG